MTHQAYWPGTSIPKSHGNALSIGRNHSLADSVSMTDFGDCFRVDIRWNDGGYVYMIHDTKQEALAHVHSLGWA